MSYLETRKEITTVKIKNKISYPEARRVFSSRTPVPGVSYANVAKKTTQANFTQTCAEHFKELEETNAPPPTKKSSPSTTTSPPPAKKKIISRPPSASPKRHPDLHPDPEILIRDIQIPVVPDVRFLGVIFDRRLTFLPHILHLRKRCEKSLNLLKVLSNTSWGADRTSLLRVYAAIVLSRIDYGCVAYGSACNSTLQKLNPVHHMALRICSAKEPFPIPTLNTPRFHYINPFATYSKSTVAPVVFQRVFAYHRSQYSRYSAIYTDGSKRADYVGCGVVIEDIMHGYRLDTSCSIFTAEAVAIYRALQLIDSTMPRKYCIYTDSMSVLEALENYHDRCHPVVCTVLDITSRMYSKGFDIVFCWLPSHVGILGNEQADSAAKSATTHLPLAVPLSDMKRVIMHHIFKIWQESWSQQLDNKLHSVKPVIGAWPVMPMRRTDVKLTRLRIGHTRFTHRHLLFGERAPECPSCHVSYTVRHILIDCPVFNLHRITFFHTSILTLSDLVGESPHQNLFAFIKKIGFLYLI
ncbi:putative RNA-directed DNA polymerase from transposon X-element [Trichonephila clavipes]|nr:putative RNA-directed DNA polymerase from transposon X-element [Trichonephila clavipes]